MNQPKITIITACFNAERTIETTIQSVLCQGYPDLEYIVVDGASNDGTLNILNKYKHRITKIISEPDHGIYDAFNKGISWATGDLIGILNADDFYAPWTLQLVAENYLEHPQCAVYYGKMFYFYENSGWWQVPALRTSDTLINAMNISHPSCFIPRKIYDTYGTFDTSYSLAADWDFLIRLYIAHEEFWPIDRILVAMRSGGASDTSPLCHLEACKIVKKYSGIESARKYFEGFVPGWVSSPPSTICDKLRWKLGLPKKNINSDAVGKMKVNWNFIKPFEFPWHLADKTSLIH